MGGLIMFNRTIQLDVVKKNKKEINELVSEENAINQVAIADVVFANASRQFALLVGTYLILDTVRKIAVNRLSK
jgi:hypothetical protein